jgi:glucan phosphoethanolaminetransferase (alkaline phosphatase superfamily)
MQNDILTALGKVAGVGGIALGVFLLIFQGVLEKNFLPQAGLSADQAFAVILSLMIITFGVAAIGIIAWLIGRNTEPHSSLSIISLFVVLVIIVIAAAVYVALRGSKNLLSEARVEAKDSAIAVGGTVNNSTIQIAPSAKRTVGK